MFGFIQQSLKGKIEEMYYYPQPSLYLTIKHKTNVNIIHQFVTIVQNTYSKCTTF